MKLKNLQYLVLLMASQAAHALPDLSEPNDILMAEWNNTVEILNTRDSTILECLVVNHRLQECKTKTVKGLTSPYKGQMPAGFIGWPLIFVSQKNTTNIYEYDIDPMTGEIMPNTAATRIPSPFDNRSGKILEFSSGIVSNYVSKDDLRQRYYLSIASDNSTDKYGQLASIDLNINRVPAAVVGWQNYDKVYLPAFTLTASTGSLVDDIIGAGNVGRSLNEQSMLSPFTSKFNQQGQLLSSYNQGGDPHRTPSFLAPNVSSIAKVNGKYWVTYTSKDKFTRYDDFPNGKPIAPDFYQAPNNSNVTIRKINPNGFNNTDYFATFADDDKVGVCSGGHDFVCSDAFRYLEVLFSNNDSNDIPETSFTSTNSNDHGTLIFRNANYSPLNANEIRRNIVIPDNLTAAFSGSCLNKVDFTSRSDAGDLNNGACTLSYDFRKLANLEPINESFDVGFSVASPFGEVPTAFHFNVNLPTAIPHFYFNNNSLPYSDLNLNSGDSGSIEVSFSNSNTESAIPQFSFLNAGRNSETLRSYFTDTGCLASDAPALSSGQSCELNYHIPPSAHNENYVIKLNNPDSVPSYVSTLNVNVSSAGHVIASLPINSGNEKTLTSLHSINIQPNSETLIRFTNLGAVDVSNFSLQFSQPPQQPFPIFFDGDCTEHPNLTALEGYCDLRIRLSNTTDLGKFKLHISGDDYAGYDLPITVGSFPLSKGIGVSDGKNGLLGSINIDQSSQGYLKVTNYTGHSVNDLMITLPDLKLSPKSAQPNNSIFYEAASNGLPSCITGSGVAGEYHIALAQLASCQIAYRVNADVYADNTDAAIQFSYHNEEQSLAYTEEQLIHLTNKNAINVINPKGEGGIDHLDFDASQPSVTISLENTSNYKVNDLHFNLSDPKLTRIFNGAECEKQSLQMGQKCNLTFSLDDEYPLFGKYSLTIAADNLQPRVVPISIALAPMNNVEIDNRGGYSMFVDYIGYYPNNAGGDKYCKSGSCYANAESGWFTNPFNTNIIALPGRSLHLNMVAGTSVSMPSCNGGKIVCTGTTLNPYCRYEGDGTDDPSSPQNQCLQFNHLGFNSPPLKAN
ncbi:hypothetical protein D5018_08775 [Parashewanella curva]|uniref:Choice-of-anchor D domain-containing protein n=1 Tax=Parashewanella curva TaxID=2338552 RepID=A0A3L8Q132_9GAMM|nr:hypothetical protein [Parashewanella curva]RLV60102.1 hypothetical protein D5018_08775 [Parashewanella curva]